MPTLVPESMQDRPQIPFEQLEEFSNRPSEGPLETTGNIAGQIAPMLVGPGELTGGKAAVSALEKILPTAGEKAAQRAVYRGPGRGFKTAEGVPTGWGPQAGQAFTKPPNTPFTWARRGGDLAELMARGGAAGAIGDPDDPLSGAAAGAAVAPVGRAAGAFMRSPLGQYAGGLGATELAYKTASAATGIPFHPLGAMIVWHSSPVGRALRRVGRYIVDHTGKVIGTVSPRGSQVAGYGAGSAYGDLFPQTPSFPTSTEDPDRTVEAR
jgi:hypothetical protein